jgi:hypothetical protein
MIRLPTQGKPVESFRHAFALFHRTLYLPHRSRALLRNGCGQVGSHVWDGLPVEVFCFR